MLLPQRTELHLLLRLRHIFSLPLISAYVFGLATSMSLMEIFSSLLLIYGVFILIKDKRFGSIFAAPLAKPLVSFSIIVLLGVLLSSATTSEKVKDIGRLRFYFFYLVLVTAFLPALREKRWLKTLLITTGIISLYGFVQHFIAIDLIRPEGKKVLMYALQEEKIGPLVVGTFNHHLTFSNIYLFFASVFFSIGLSSCKGRWGYFAFGMFLFVLVAWTHSRIAWIAIPFVVFTVLFFSQRKKLALASLVFSVLFLSAVYWLSPSIRERFGRSFDTSQEVSIFPRMTLWQAQWEIFKDYPFIGIGWNNNERRSKEYVDAISPGTKNFYGHAHSMPLQVLANTGIAGAVAFFWLWWEFFTRAIRGIRGNSHSENKAILVGVLAGFVGFWIQGLTQWNFGDAEVLHNVIFFWAVQGALCET